jgi:YD repeat-containing protein
MIVEALHSRSNPTLRTQDSKPTTWTYDALGRLTGEKYGGTPAYNHTFAYDSVGNRTMWHKGGTGFSEKYHLNTYDKADQLTHRTEKDGLPQTDWTYVHDERGNMTEWGQGAGLPLSNPTTYAYDLANRMISIIASGGLRSTYTYDGDGLRRSKWEPAGSLTTFVWDGDDVLQERTD